MELLVLRPIEDESESSTHSVFAKRKVLQNVTQNFTTEPVDFGYLIGELSEIIRDIREEMPVGKTLLPGNSVFLPGFFCFPTSGRFIYWPEKEILNVSALPKSPQLSTIRGPFVSNELCADDRIRL